jgi:hypothetical protein
MGSHSPRPNRRLVGRNLPGYAYRGPVYYVDNHQYYGVDGDYSDVDSPKVSPTYLVGKVLVRNGQQPLELVNQGYLTDNQSKKYIWESTLPTPYKIIMPDAAPGDITYGGLGSVLLVLINKNNVIINTVYSSPS